MLPPRKSHNVCLTIKTLIEVVRSYMREFVRASAIGTVFMGTNVRCFFQKRRQAIVQGMRAEHRNFIGPASDICRIRHRSIRGQARKTDRTSARPRIEFSLRCESAVQMFSKKFAMEPAQDRACMGRSTARDGRRLPACYK